MNRTLYKKFILAYVIFGIIGFVFLSTAGSRLIERQMTKVCSSALTREARSIAESQAGRFYMENSTLQSLYDSLDALGTYQNATIWLISPEGELLLDTSQPLNTENTRTIPDFDPVALGSNYYSTGDFFGQFDEDMLSVMVPVTYNYAIKGYVTIHTPMSDIYHQRESMLRWVDLLFLAIFFFSFGILALFGFTVYRPLKKIIQGADEYARGNLTWQISVNSQDEMGYLARTLNYMSGELNQTGEYQKKFVANVSHDFRSPLTSIKGYVEAIADGTIPQEMQDRYLKIILFETERLNKLTQSLLTLNDIDSKANMLDITKFDINGVIRNTAAAFEGICTSRRITIHLVIPSPTLFVSADMEKIQQVLYNLIDNAVKFSNNDSTITVETSEKYRKVFVSVKDTGIGIPKESLSRIWERFYKIDASRGKDRKGTGLGLSIVKEIIAAHGQNINVISTEGVGTEFIFTLDKAE